MKNTLQGNFSFQIVLMLVFIFFTSMVLAQDTGSEEAREFKILFESTEQEIKITCREGCAFQFLRFNLKPYQVQTIDQNGMVSVSGDQSSPHLNGGEFKFKLRRIENGFEFEGISGTNWKSLHFNCNNLTCRQWIDQKGMLSE